MKQQFDDELYIPDEEMKVPEAARLQPEPGGDWGKRLVTVLSISIAFTLLALAGLYLYDRFLTAPDAAEPAAPARPTAAENQEPESPTARAEVDTMQALSPSDNLSTIITDLENTNLNNLDAELTTIDNELE